MNSLTITGNLGKDCETRFLPDGSPVTSFSVADSQGRDKPSIWWECAIFGKRAESLAQYLTKGQTVTVIGSVTEKEWNDKDGNKRKSMNVRVNDIALQGGKREGGTEGCQGGTGQRDTKQGARAPKPADDFADDSDVPF